MKNKAISVIGNYRETIEKSKNLLNSNDYNGKVVVYSNALARQASKFTLEEEKVMHMIFANINPYEKNNTRIILNKADFIEKLNANKSKSNHTDLHNLMSGMIKKSLIKIKADKTNMIGVVISGVKWEEYGRTIEIELNPMFMPYIEELASFYTKLELDAIITFNSKYTLSLYKFLASWNDEHFNRMISISTEELKIIFNLNKEEYTNKQGAFDRYNFEKYAIKKAVNEINAKVPGWRMKIEKIKKGNKVSGYLFEWIILNK